MFNDLPLRVRIILVALISGIAWTLLMHDLGVRTPHFFGVFVAVSIFTIFEGWSYLAYRLGRRRSHEEIEQAVKEGRAGMLGIGLGPDRTLIIQTNIELPRRVMVCEMDGTQHIFVPAPDGSD